jgi:Rod binding domain-containing protein
MSLPVINQALEPASVRSGGPAAQKEYASALDFESMLVQQLSQSLSASNETAETGTAGEGEGETANPELSSMLPQALTESVMNHGGLGLAPQLMTALHPGAAATVGAKLSPTGGVASAGAAGVGVASAGIASAGVANGGAAA